MIRLGVTGLGWLGESIIADALKLPDVEVVAVHDVRPGVAEEVAEHYGIRSATRCFDDLAYGRTVRGDRPL